MTRIRTIALEERTAQAFRMNSGDRIACREGLVWITAEGMPGDHLLHAGDTWIAPHRVNAVAQALRRPAICRYLPREAPARPWTAKLVALLRRVAGGPAAA